MTRFKCQVCDFELWEPIAELAVSTLGLYNDARFPGRCLLVLNQHLEDFSLLEPDLLLAFNLDAQRSGKALAEATSARRINYAVLGNAQTHLHFHLIPRYPEAEQFPKKSPWSDPRLPIRLDDEVVIQLVKKISGALTEAQKT
jgi:diadenosine tetraphosphate (Ap4A) HIT family hydrolase